MNKGPFIARAVAIVLCAPPLLAGELRDSEAVLRTATRACDAGLRALRQGNFAKARTNLERAVATLPAYPEAHLGLGHVAMSEHRFEDALREYRSARSGYTEWGERLVDVRMQRYGEIQQEIGRLRDSLMMLQGNYGKTLSPTLVQTTTLRLENQIRQLESMDQPDATEPLGPPAEVEFAIGNALWRLDRPVEALESWLRCAEIDRAFPLVYNNIAVARWHRGEYGQALTSLQRAESLGVHVDPEFRDGLVAAIRRQEGFTEP